MRCSFPAARGPSRTAELFPPRIQGPGEGIRSEAARLRRAPRCGSQKRTPPKRTLPTRRRGCGCPPASPPAPCRRHHSSPPPPACTASPGPGGGRRVTASQGRRAGHQAPTRLVWEAADARSWAALRGAAGCGGWRPWRRASRGPSRSRKDAGGSYRVWVSWRRFRVGEYTLPAHHTHLYWEMRARARQRAWSCTSAPQAA